MVNLTHVTNIVAKELIGTVDTISRVRKALGDSIDLNTLPKKTVIVSTPASQGSPAAVASDSAEGETIAKGSGTNAVQTVGDGDGDGIETRQLSQVYGGPITQIKLPNHSDQVTTSLRSSYPITQIRLQLLYAKDVYEAPNRQ